jgi:hypothetical protein
VIRRLLSLVIVTAMAMALLPAAVAFAAANATASIAAGNRDLLPGAHNFTVTVTSTEANTPLIGTRINAVFINVPAGPAGVTLQDGSFGTAPAGWTPTIVKAGNLQTIEYRTSGSGIAGGSSLSFTFPATVVAPLSADRVGTFTVAVSSDGGNNVRNAAASAAGALTTRVRILELIPGSLKPTAPAGVTNGTATAEQKGIAYEFQVRNHSRSALTIDGKLSSALETINGSLGEGTTSVAVDPGQTGTFPFTVDLGPASANRTATFAANAVVGTAAAAIQRTAALTVQIRPVLSIANLQPNRTASSRDLITIKRDFTASATKNGGPALNITAGTLEFASVVGDKAGTMTVPVNFTNTSAQTIRFDDVTVLGAPGVHSATLRFTGVDANGKAFDQENVVTLPNAITIDNLGPVINLVQSALPTTHGIQQLAAKPGNTINVAVEVVAPEDKDIDASSLKVVLEQNIGGAIPVSCPPATSDGGGKVTCSGSVTTTGANAFDDRATTFSAKATIKDTAGNETTLTETATRIIDRDIPALDAPGRTASLRTIRVEFKDNLSFPIYGGCDPSQYTIDDIPLSVTKVSFDGSDDQCPRNGKDAVGSGVRILHLRNAMGPSDTPRVRYTPGNRNLSNADPVFDGAAHDAIGALINTVLGVRPHAPDLTGVFRNTAQGQARETAYFDSSEPARFAGGPSGAYFTRFVGDDLVIRFGGVQDGWSLQVLNAAGQEVARQDNLSRDTNALQQRQPTQREIRVPLPQNAADGTYLFQMRYIAPSSPEPLLGDLTAFQVVLDRALPRVASTALEPNSATQVRAVFSEKIVEGTNHSADWTANWITPNEEDPDSRTYSQVDGVEVVDEQTRLLTIPTVDFGPYGGTDYLLRSTNGLRYKDRAGNALNNTLG